MHPRASEFRLQIGLESVTMHHLPCGFLCAIGHEISLASAIAAMETHLDPMRPDPLFSCPIPPADLPPLTAGAPTAAEVAAARLKLAIAAKRGEEVEPWVQAIAAGRLPSKAEAVERQKDEPT